MCLAISTIPIGIIGGIEGFQSSYILIGLIFLVTFVVSIMISYLITRPLEKLTDNIIQISKGKLDVELATSEIHEINNLTDSLNRIMASLKLAIHKVGVKKGEIFQDNTIAEEISKNKKGDLIDTISGWMWETDPKGKYTYCSNNVAKFLGYTPEEIIGKNIFDTVNFENGHESKQVFKNAINQKEPISNIENWITNKNGERIYIRTNGVPLLDEKGNLIGYRGMNTDITNEKDAETKIVELNTKVSDLKMEINDLKHDRESDSNIEQKADIKNKQDEKNEDSKIDYVFIFDENANILACTDTMYKKLGYTKDEILSLKITDFDALETTQEIKEKINQAKKNGHFSFKTIHRCKDGSKLLVYENFQYLKDKNAFRCIVKEDFSENK